MSPSPGRWLRFSLRTLFALVTLVACLSAWLVHERHKIAARREALLAAGIVPDSPPSLEQQPAWRVWLLGNDWPRFATGLGLWMDAPPLGDDTLAQLQGLTQLKRIDFCYSRVTDADLANLRGLSKLEDLYLAGNPISDAGLLNPSGLLSLKQLQLHNTRITEEGSRATSGVAGVHDCVRISSSEISAGGACGSEFPFSSDQPALSIPRRHRPRFSPGG